MIRGMPLLDRYIVSELKVCQIRSKTIQSFSEHAPFLTEHGDARHTFTLPPSAQPADRHSPLGPNSDLLRHRICCSEVTFVVQLARGEKGGSQVLEDEDEDSNR